MDLGDLSQEYHIQWYMERAICNFGRIHGPYEKRGAKELRIESSKYTIDLVALLFSFEVSSQYLIWTFTHIYINIYIYIQFIYIYICIYR